MPVYTMADAPVNTVILHVEAPKKPRVRSKRPPKATEEVKAVEGGPKDASAPIPVVDQRTETARSGRRSRLPKNTSDIGIPLSKVDYTVIKSTKDPLAVRDQLMREYFASQKHTDELVQKLCALVFKHH